MLEVVFALYISGVSWFSIVIQLLTDSKLLKGFFFC